MRKKIRIGIVFGGSSREREISFAGGRTVYDNLNKSLFEAVPVFVDSFNNFIELQWEFIYKGSIRDFYPPVSFLPAGTQFQLYAENLGEFTMEKAASFVTPIGKILSIEELKKKIDIAFLCLHGPYGEDGRIQGLLEFNGISYTGSGVLASAIGIDKSVQKELMRAKGFNCPPIIAIQREDWIAGKASNAYDEVKKAVGFPCVVKPANQGSSIGVSILEKEEKLAYMKAVEKALFTRWIEAEDWKGFNAEEKLAYVKSLADIREGIGLPALISYPASLGRPVIYDPESLIRFLDEHLKESGFVLESMDAESTVLLEGFIKGREFSCIVITDEQGRALALPPTEIRKGAEIYDYRSKYLPGLSRKITPMDLPDEQLQRIRKECERLFYELHFDVYARIDGFLGDDGQVYLNDPNTTSGMMPSSFFFHQAAEIGLNPSQFLTYIIRSSLSVRARHMNNAGLSRMLLELDSNISEDRNASVNKTRVAVVLGGYSSERHISVESGRNVFEKLSSSEKYLPFPVLLTGSNSEHRLYRLPINLLLKDNADDIREKAEHFSEHPLLAQIKQECAAITSKYASAAQTAAPKKLSYEELAADADEVFIALHGRPGEDGEVQARLDKLGIPYNGSGKESSSLTIDKYTTNEILKENGFLVANHLLVERVEWLSDKAAVKRKLEKEIGYPFIAKPVDDGCSSAVKKIKSFAEFEAFCTLIFRDTGSDLDPAASRKLQIRPKEEFPCKQLVLVEELISKRDADHFLEITGGMLTRYNSRGELEYEVFEASEALSEGEVLSLEEKFLAGQGQNITPARYAKDHAERNRVSEQVKATLGAAARVLGVTGYCRIDAFVRIYKDKKVEVIFIEVNSLPGMTPATCIFHQAAISHYKPYEFIDNILEFGRQRQKRVSSVPEAR
jgi:UDP-N-acetylmuramate--alanine ligase